MTIWQWPEEGYALDDCVYWPLFDSNCGGRIAVAETAAGVTIVCENCLNKNQITNR